MIGNGTFKHHFNERNSYEMRHLIEVFGLSGYYYYFALIELCVAHGTKGETGFADIHASILRKELRVNAKKLDNCLDVMQTLNLIFYIKNEFSFKISLVKFPKLLTLSRSNSEKKDVLISKKAIVGKRKTKKTLIADDEIKTILDHLNIKTGRNYKYTTATTLKLINARRSEGFEVRDFLKVIDNQCKAWMNSEMEQYLRPETLFGDKFDGYVNNNINKETFDVDETWKMIK